MPIIQPFMASRRFTSTLGAGTGTGAAFAVAATACLNDAGTTGAITIPGGDALDGGIPITIEFIVT
ncbi:MULTISPECIES: hypothetical protein [Bacillus]|uniref:hypothetical protein n=1 Tax=Bacillus TaxID=1386 RepID=UPI0003306587|nr:MULTISPECIES: hypothetical protein [Bacillus]EOP25303.1 hypothetical protein IIS_01608 [Bacillus cereus VD131]KAF6557302.1 hypothetical protein G9F74_14295 [Bacillus sp. EKM202B]MBJ8042040.1 hypothetical protein [Bacillus cereus group sp. N17]MCU5305649.1 hypothetical protein [Bacillus toyonensis]MDD9263247.1 hypothetical protein [Bacillus toyonensis]